MRQIQDSVFRSKTDKRMVYDVLVPGFATGDIEAFVRKSDDATQTFVVVKGKANPYPALDTDGNPDSFGYNAIKEDFKVTLDVPMGFDAKKVTVMVANGVVRVTIERTAETLGSALSVVEGM